MSLQKYIILVKMTKAKDILSGRDATIKEVAADVGIQDENILCASQKNRRHDAGCIPQSVLRNPFNKFKGVGMNAPFP
ncbi:hypothetical protein NNA46_22095, partial [Alkalihalobacillus clausii]|nr:hypothetical protein [Shouchella clausii]